MTRFPISRYFFTTSPKSCWGPSFLARMCQFPQATLLKRAFIWVFFHFVGSGEPMQVLRKAKHTQQPPDQKETQSRFSLSPDSFLPFIMDAELVFHLVDSTVPSTETSCTTTRPPSTVTRKQVEETAAPAVTPASGSGPETAVWFCVKPDFRGRRKTVALRLWDRPQGPTRLRWGVWICGCQFPSRWRRRRLGTQRGWKSARSCLRLHNDWPL